MSLDGPKITSAIGEVAACVKVRMCQTGHSVMDAVKVFISSTWIDLLPERSAVEKALHHFRSTRFVGMEYFGTRDSSTATVSLEEIDASDIYVGVIGHRYGSGITEQEYRRASQRGLPCLVYLKASPPPDKPDPGDGARRLESLRAELQQKHTVCIFHTPGELAVRVVADLHNAVFDRLIVQGIGLLRSDYDARIERFLAEYLGDSRRPIAFGGRERELARLDRWLHRAQSAPYALLAGPAGRGKSALLVRWARRVTRENDVAVIFFPVSIRFRTNLASVVYASISARLASLHGEPVPGAVDTPAEVWRALMSGYLARNLPDERRLLLILDGADEGADWQIDPQLFPSSPPSGLRVLVSARYLAGDVDSGGWIQRLDWSRTGLAEAIDLAPLNPQGLVEVLRGMSVPMDVLSGRADIVAELFRLTQGDPLLVNLYVSDLWTRGEEVARLKPTDLAGLAPGLEGFFRRWWDDQRALWGVQSPLREPAVNEVLNTLSCALGPLLSEELLELLPPDCGILIWALEDVVRLLQRFVIGDGHVQGYAFSHPRLADYFYERLTKAKQAKGQEARFISWGLDHLSALDGGRQPSNLVPTYVLQFMRRHMERCNSDPSSFLVLTSKAWVLAWERLDRGSYTGFVGDLNRVRQIAAQQNDALARRGKFSGFVAAELRCALCTSSIASLAGDMSVSALLAFIRKDIWSPAQAIAYAANISIVPQRLRVLFELTGRIEVTHRPLALAAALVEIRPLLLTSEGRTLVQGVISALVAENANSLSVSDAASIVEAVCGVADQLDQPEREWCLQTLRAERPRNPPERFAAACLALAPHLAAPEALAVRGEAMSALQQLAGAPENLPPALAGDRLLLLRDAIETEGPAASDRLLLAALRTAIEAVALTASRSDKAHEELVDVGLSCLRQLPSRDLPWGLRRLAPTLAPRHIDPLVAEYLVNRAPDDRLRALVQCLLGARPEVRAPVVKALTRQVTSAQCSSEELREQLCLAAERLSGEEVILWLEKADAEADSESIIRVCCRVAQALEPSALHAELSQRVLRAMRRPMSSRSRLDAVVGLLDYGAQAGAQDSLEAWRPPLDERTLALPIFRLLSDAATPVQDVADAVSYVVDNGRVGWLSDATQMRLRGLLVDARPAFEPVRSPSEAANIVPTSPPERLFRILEDHPVPTDMFSEAVRDLVGEIGARPALGALAQIAHRLPHDVQQLAAREILFGVDAYSCSAGELCATIAAIAVPALFPPGSDLLAAATGIVQTAGTQWRTSADDIDRAIRKVSLPDIVRQELLRVRLRALVETPDPDGEREQEALLLDVGMLSSPSVEILGLALTALGQVARGEIFNRVDSWKMCLLERLMPQLTLGLLPHFLECFGDTDLDERRSMLRLLQERRYKHSTTHWREVVEAVRRLPVPRQRAIWLMSIAGLVGDNVAIDVSSMLSGADDEADRLLMLCAVIPVSRQPEHRKLLLEALELAQGDGMLAILGRGLVQIAADRYADDAAVMARAATTAVALSEPKMRGDALAELAEGLTPDEMVRGATALRRVNDAPGRVRAMSTIAQAITDLPRRRKAVERIWASIQTLESATQAAASLYVARALPDAVKWAAMASSFDRLRRDRAGFEKSELLLAAAGALIDAPARLCQRAISWMQKLPADQLRAETAFALLPHLPVWLQVPALGMMAQHIKKGSGLERIAIHVADPVFSQFEESLSTFAPAIRRVLNTIIDLRVEAEAPSVKGPVSTHDPDERVAELLTSGSELKRASIIKFMALHPELGPRWQAGLISVTGMLRGDEVRASVARYLSVLSMDESFQKATCAIRGIESLADRAAALTQLALRHAASAKERLLDEAVGYVRAEPDQFCRFQAAIEVATSAPECLSACLEIIRTTADVDAIAQTMRELIGRLSDEDAGTAVAYLQTFRDERLCLRVILEVAPKLGSAAAAAALGVIQRLSSEVARSRALCRLVPCLSEHDLISCESVLEGIRVDFAWLEALAAMTLRWSACLTADRAVKACDTLMDIDDDEFVAAWVQHVACAWPDAHQHLLVRSLRRLTSSTWHREALSAIVRHCQCVDRQTLLAEMRRMDDPFDCSVALGHLASMDRPVDLVLFEEAVCLASQAGGRRRYVDALVLMAASAQSVAEPLLEKLLDECERLPLQVISALKTVCCWMTQTQAARVLQRIEEWHAGRYGVESAELFRALAERLDPRMLPVLIEQTSRLCSERVVSAFLCDVAPLLCEDASAASAFTVAARMGSKVFRAESLTGLLICFDERRQTQTVLLLADVVSEHERLQRLIRLLPDLKPIVRAKVLEEGRRFNHSEYSKCLAEAIERADTGAWTLTQETISPLPVADDGAQLETALQALIEDAVRRQPIPDGDRVRETKPGHVWSGGAVASVRCLLSPYADPTARRSAHTPIRPYADATEVISKLHQIESEVDRLREVLRSLERLSKSECDVLILQLPGFLRENRLADALLAILALDVAPDAGAVLSAVRFLEEGGNVRRVLARLVGRATDHALPALNEYLHEEFTKGGRRERQHLLQRLELLTPLIARLGGDSALEEVVEAIDDVGILWP